MHELTIPVVLVVATVMGSFVHIRDGLRYLMNFGLPDGENVMERLGPDDEGPMAA